MLPSALRALTRGSSNTIHFAMNAAARRSTVSAGSRSGNPAHMELCASQPRMHLPGMTPGMQTLSSQVISRWGAVQRSRVCVTSPGFAGGSWHWSRQTAAGHGIHRPSLLAMSTVAASSGGGTPSRGTVAESTLPGESDTARPAGGSDSAGQASQAAAEAVVGNGSQQAASGQEGEPPLDDDVQIGYTKMGSMQGSHGLFLSGGAFVLPHPEKMAKGGEDWYFIAANCRAIGVADGVGGWAEVGVDAGAYARGIMNHAATVADGIAKVGQPWC